ncbi:MAG: hypothetical protein QM756_28655 [Polyangiaceae bacterium]
MRPGLRLQLLVLLGGLLLFSFLPLYVAVSTYTKVGVATNPYRSRARARASRGSASRRSAHATSLRASSPLLRAEVGSEGVETISIYDSSGTC